MRITCRLLCITLSWISAISVTSARGDIFRGSSRAAEIYDEKQDVVAIKGWHLAHRRLMKGMEKKNGRSKSSDDKHQKTVTPTPPVPAPEPSPAPSSTPTPGPDCDLTSSVRVGIGTVYDTLVLEGVDESQVTWDVAFASSFTQFQFSGIKYVSSEDTPDDNGQAEDVFINRVAATAPNQSDILNTTLFISISSMLQEANSSGCLIGNGGFKVHVTLPRAVTEICLASSFCRPVLCPLGIYGSRDDPRSYNFVPGNSSLFVGSRNCSLAKPAFWDEWLLYYFGNRSGDSSYAFETFALADVDNDGLSNIIEYYGLDLVNLYADLNKTNPLNATNRLLGSTFPPTGTDPTKFDTDGDLFPDGYELQFGLDPLIQNSREADSDGDGLTDFEELRFATNPRKPDSDSDSIPDDTEIERGTDPNNSRETEPDYRLGVVRVVLSIGDPSGSRSERYVLNVGDVQHASPEFGVVSSAQYAFEPGSYTISMAHLASKIPRPDYDYQAGVSVLSPAPPGLSVSLDDPNNLLRYYVTGGTTGDTFSGKTATLNISLIDDYTPPAPGDSNSGNNFVCGRDHLQCQPCNDDSRCIWSADQKFCKFWFPQDGRRPSNLQCAEAPGSPPEDPDINEGGDELEDGIDDDPDGNNSGVDTNEGKVCGRDHDNCESCNADKLCQWNSNTNFCNFFFPFNGVKGTYRDCGCSKCSAWAEKERQEIEKFDWVLAYLPICPCALNSIFPFVEAAGPDPDCGPVDWFKDLACTPAGCPFHKPAYVCIRAEAFEGDFGQQCCYDRNLNLITYTDNHLAAGSPDKERPEIGNIGDHEEADVKTFENCCTKCGINSSECYEYTGNPFNGNRGVRSDPRTCI